MILFFGFNWIVKREMNMQSDSVSQQNQMFYRKGHFDFRLTLTKRPSVVHTHRNQKNYSEGPETQ